MRLHPTFLAVVMSIAWLFPTAAHAQNQQLNQLVRRYYAISGMKKHRAEQEAILKAIAEYGARAKPAVPILWKRYYKLSAAKVSHHTEEAIDLLHTLGKLGKTSSSVLQNLEQRYWKLMRFPQFRAEANAVNMTIARIRLSMAGKNLDKLMNKNKNNRRPFQRNFK